LPGQQLPVNFLLKNDSSTDLYVYRVGIRTAWMGGTWFNQDVKELIKGGNQRWFNFQVPIPHDVGLGNYELVFGVEGQYLPGSQLQPQVEWSRPAVLQVKKPWIGLRVFFSHSNDDMSLVTRLKDSLDNDGIEVILAEEKLEPGVVLEEKFQRLIRESGLVIALLTDNGVRSSWVIKEVNYAFQIGKPCILLKEESVTLATDREWVKFSKYDSHEVLSQKVKEAIEVVRGKISQPNILGAIIAVGLLAFVVAAIADSK
jgi:hypothetical protein